MNFFERARIVPGIRILTALLLAPIVRLPCAAGTTCPAQEPPRVPAPAILSTDLSLDRDPDDWFDTSLFLTLPGIEPKGIVLEHYATDEVLEKTKELLRLVGRAEVPVVKGIAGRLERRHGGLTAPPHHDGAELILRTLRASKDKVTLIAVGGLGNEAWALHRDPALCREKIAAIYFVGGNPFGHRDTNVARDTVAAEIVMESDVPIAWVATCAPDQMQKLTGGQEAAIANMGHPVTDFLAGTLGPWRAFRGETWLRKTGQLPGQGKNLWSLPAFSHAAGLDVGNPVWLRGHAHFNAERWTWFETDPRGPDRMMVACDARSLCEWIVRHIRAVAEGSAIPQQ